MTGLAGHKSSIGTALAAAAVAAALLGPVAAQTQSPPLAKLEQWDAGVRNSVMRRVARLKVFVPSDGRVKLGSGFVVDQKNQLVLTSCRILVAEWRTLEIDLAFATGLNMKRTVEPLLCDRDLDLAIVRVRELETDFPRALEPPAAHRTSPGDGLYILGFWYVTADFIPAAVDVDDTELPGLAGRFLLVRSKRPPSPYMDASDDLDSLVGGPVVTPQGDLVGVTAFRSGERIRDSRSGFALATVPPGTYLARTVDTIAPLVRQALALRP